MGRVSIGSVGSDMRRTSSSSNGSREGRGAEAYIAPGSPGGDFGSSSLDRQNGLSYQYPPSYEDGIRARTVSNLSMPEAARYQFSLNVGEGARARLPSVNGAVAWAGAPVSIPLTEKEQRKMKKEREKMQKEYEKQRKKEEKKKGKKGDTRVEREAMAELGWCRPPMPTPEASVPVGEDEPPYYSSPRPYTNHLEDLKKMLRESEICDCGLRMLDAELIDGWTVHRSRESATYKRVFYQHENGNTTWQFPEDVADLLTVKQVEFIVGLCKEANQPIPAHIMRRHEAILQVPPFLTFSFPLHSV
jgi:hypothetical protein